MSMDSGQEATRLCKTCGGTSAFYSCLECTGFLCETCVEAHTKGCNGTSGPGTNGSNGLTESDIGNQGNVGRDEAGYCQQHAGKQLDMFCNQHDVFVCTACVDMQHRKCKDVSSVSKLAQKVTKSKEYKNFSSSLNHVRERLSRIRKDQKDAHKRLRHDTDSSLSAIAEFRKDINWVLDRLEKKGKGFVEKRYKELNKRIEEDISACDDMINDLDKLIRKLESKEDKSNVFYSVKKDKNTLVMAEKVCQEMKSGTDVNDIVKFAVDPKVKEFAMGLGWYGKDKTYLSFEPPVSLPHMYTIKNETNFDMKIKGDKNICSITSACQLHDGTFIIADKANKKIKHVDITYKVADVLTASGEPLTCNLISESSAAVSVSDGNRHVIQFVGIENNQFTNTGEISVDKPSKGLTASTDKLIIAFEDSISEHTYTGEFVRQIYKNDSDKIQSFIANDVGSKLFVSHETGTIVQLDTDGVILREMRDANLKVPRGITLDRTDQLFVAGHESNNVCMFSHEGEPMGALNNQSHKYKNIQMVCYDRFNCRLVLALRCSNMIKVCDLK